MWQFTLADPKGGGAPWVLAPSIQFLGIIGQNNMLAQPQLGLLPIRLANPGSAIYLANDICTSQRFLLGSSL